MSTEPASPAPAGAEKKLLVGLIEGIIYLTKSDQEFVDMYVTGRKGWF
jgi:hypothetical protein